MAPLTFNKASGLNTQPNELSTQPGALSVAENVEINRDGVVEVARGFEDFSSNLPDFTPAQLFAIGGVAYLHLDNGIWYHDGTRWLRKRGAYGVRSTIGDMIVIGDHLYYALGQAILDLNMATGGVSVLAGRVGVAAVTDGTGDAARFASLRGMATDGTSLYVADSVTIRRVVISTGAVTTIAGTAGASGTTDATGAAARFDTPSGVTYLGGDLYVTDSAQHTVRRVAAPLTVGAGVVTTIAGTAGANAATDGTGAAARFDTPLAVTNDGTYLYVCDTTNFKIRRLAPPLTAGAAVVTSIAGNAIPGSADGTGSAGRFNTPWGITYMGGNLYVSDGTGTYAVRKLAPPLTAGAAVVTTPLGSAGSSASTDAIGTGARFSQPRWITSDGSTLYVADGGQAIRKIYPSLYATTILGISSLSGANTAPPFADGIFLGPS